MFVDPSGLMIKGDNPFGDSDESDTPPVSRFPDVYGPDRHGPANSPEDDDIFPDSASANPTRSDCEPNLRPGIYLNGLGNDSAGLGGARQRGPLNQRFFDNADELFEILEIIANHEPNPGPLVLIVHSGPGGFYIDVGKTQKVILNGENYDRFIKAVARIDTPSLTIIGCRVAWGPKGKAFLQQMAIDLNLPVAGTVPVIYPDYDQRGTGGSEAKYPWRIFLPGGWSGRPFDERFPFEIPFIIQ